ncbi:hypothetical protein SNEBB_008767 [Seison nebaliae]|nr:hypothetical protein SNEBB_008767 [Seison nebaliae]
MFSRQNKSSTKATAIRNAKKWQSLVEKEIKKVIGDLKKLDKILKNERDFKELNHLHKELRIKQKDLRKLFKDNEIKKNEEKDLIKIFDTTKKKYEDGNKKIDEKLEKMKSLIEAVKDSDDSSDSETEVSTVSEKSETEKENESDAPSSNEEDVEKAEEKKKEIKSKEKRKKIRIKEEKEEENTEDEETKKKDEDLSEAETTTSTKKKSKKIEKEHKTKIERIPIRGRSSSSVSEFSSEGEVKIEKKRNKIVSSNESLNSKKEKPIVKKPSFKFKNFFSRKKEKVEIEENEKKRENLTKTETSSKKSECSEDEEISSNHSSFTGPDEKIRLNDETNQSIHSQISQTSYEVYYSSYDYEGAKEDDLSVRKGDRLELIRKIGDWFQMRNDQDEIGLVPSNILTNNFGDISEDSDGDHEDISQDEKPLRHSSRKSSSSNRMEDDRIDQTSHNLNNSQQSLQIKSPSSPLTSPNGRKKGAEKRILAFQKELHIKQAGFAPSELAELRLDRQYTLHSTLVVKLTPAGFHYSGVQTNNDKKNEDVEVDFQRKIQLISCLGMLAPFEEEYPQTIQSRHIYISLCEGNNIISNIRHIKIMKTSANDQQWIFDSRYNENSSTSSELLIKCQVVHSTNSNSSLKNSKEIIPSIVIETAISILNKKEEMVEISCGWTTFPLYDINNKTIVTNRKYEAKLRGGRLFTPDMQLSEGKNQSRIVFKLLNVSKEQEDDFKYLISPAIYMSGMNGKFVRYFRQHLLELLKGERQNNETDLIYSPFLTNFCDVVEQSDLIDELRIIWTEQLKKNKNINKKDNNQMCQFFVKIFNQFAYPLVVELNDKKLYYEFTNDDAMKKRAQLLTCYSHCFQENGNLLKILGDPFSRHADFNLKEVSYSILTM